ncbi:MAG: type II secretion system F family protein [Symbiobacteriia bacterium]
MRASAVAAVAGAQVGLVLLLSGWRRRAQAARWMRPTRRDSPLGAGHLDTGLRGRALPGMRLPGAVTRLLPAPSQLDLVRAGLEQRLAPESLVSVQVVLGLAGLMMSAAAGLLNPRLATPVLPLAGAVAGVVAPRLWLERAARRRQAAVLRDLPGVIDLLAICSASGLNLTQSLQTVAAEQPGVVGKELRQVIRLVQAGRPATAALRAMADRVRLPEVTALANSLILAESLGTPVVDLFRSQAEMSRQQQRRRVEDAVGKLPMKFTLVSVFLILPSLFVLTVLPNVLAFLESQW